MTRPVRLQLSRKKGFNLQALSRAINGLPAVRVARRSIFGNPFVVGVDGDQAQCVERFRRAIAAAERKSLGIRPDTRKMLANLVRLRGCNLACWCKPDQPCHADVLLELANR